MELKDIKSPKDIRDLGAAELAGLAEQIRHFLITTVAKTGGHLASNLGVVELTLALHKSFNTPADRIIWDVGHQSYVHKLITGRYDVFETLRQKGGISGFPKMSESRYDVFGVGHSSTSISAALGIAKARDLSDGQYHVIAVIGDGAMTGGLAYEALNDAGSTIKKNFLVVLNDNEMSVTQNVGAMSSYLTKIRHQPAYWGFKKSFEEKMVRTFGRWGTYLVRGLKYVKDTVKRVILSSNTFEDLGYTYIGPVDGHDIKKLCKVFEQIKTVQGPVLLHVKTKKGKGYEFAEQKPGKFHGIGSFDIETGETNGKAYRDYSAVFGQALCSIAKNDDKVCAITPSMTLGSGLSEFAAEYPSRFFDVGIAEAHAVTFAAGLAASGYKPVVSVYSSFLQRAYDSIIHDVALQKLHVVFCVDRAGAIGADGVTHQGIYDLSYLGHVPGMAILAPANFKELEQMLSFAVKDYDGPIAVRYPRGGVLATPGGADFEFGKSETVRGGNDLTLLCVGRMVLVGHMVADLLSQKGVEARVVNMRTVRPFDKKVIFESIKSSSILVTIEDNVAEGGFGSEVARFVSEEALRAKVMVKAFPTGLVEHATESEQFEEFGLDAETIAKEILNRYFK